MIKNYILKKRIEQSGLGIALGGGAVRGFFHIGVLRAIEEFPIKISYVAGISIGSLIGGLYAAGYTVDKIHKLLNKHAELKNLFNVASFTLFNKHGIFSGENLVKEINRLVQNTPIENFDTPFVCRAVDLIHFKEVIFDSGDLGIAIKASCAIPGVFTPEEQDPTTLLVDGGVLGSVPISLIRSKFDGPILTSNLIDYDNLSSSQAQKIIHSFSSNIIHKMLPFTEMLVRSFYIMQSQIFSLELEKYKPDISIAFNETYYPNITNIMEIKDFLVADGYKQTKKKLQEIGF